MAAIPTPAHHAGWTILIVPPRPDRPTRTFRLKKKHLKFVLSVLSALLVSTTGLLLLGSFVHTETQAQLADAQALVQSLTDSLRQLRTPAVGGGYFTPGTANAHPAPLGTGPRPAATRVARPRSDVGASTPAPGVVLPVIGRITSRFARSRFHPLLHIFRPHHGVDVSAPYGTDITAPASGRVTFVGRKMGDGLMVQLDHGDGVVSLYAHCKSVTVRAGDIVSAGTKIATVGSSGLATGPHVHFEVRVHGKPVDPLRYLIEPRDNAPAAEVRPAGTEHIVPELQPQPLTPSGVAPVPAVPGTSATGSASSSGVRQ